MIAPTRDHRRPPRTRHTVLWLAALAAAVLVFAVGVAVGEAIHDNPKPGITTTRERTLTP